MPSLLAVKLLFKSTLPHEAIPKAPSRNLSFEYYIMQLLYKAPIVMWWYVSHHSTKKHKSHQLFISLNTHRVSVRATIVQQGVLTPVSSQSTHLLVCVCQLTISAANSGAIMLPTTLQTSNGQEIGPDYPKSPEQVYTLATFVSK